VAGRWSSGRSRSSCVSPAECVSPELPGLKWMVYWIDRGHTE
jgi:hypothetical protein